MAQDRIAWQQALVRWQQYWGFSSDPLLHIETSLLDRQLLLVGDAVAVLRPARLFPDEPYATDVQKITVGRPTKSHWFVWVQHCPQAVSVVVVPPRSSARTQLLLQGKASDNLLEVRLLLWDMLLKLYNALPELCDVNCTCFLPISAFGQHIWAHRVPLTKLFEVQRLDRLEVNLNFLRFCALQPKETPTWIETSLLNVAGPFPGTYKFLIRSGNFSDARFFRSLQDFVRLPRSHGT